MFNSVVGGGKDNVSDVEADAYPPKLEEPLNIFIYKLVCIRDPGLGDIDDVKGLKLNVPYSGFSVDRLFQVQSDWNGRTLD